LTNLELTLEEVWQMPLSVLLDSAQADGPGSSLDVRGADKAAFLIQGSFEAEIRFEASFDGSTWFPYMGQVGAGRALMGSAGKPGFVLFDTEAVAYLRPVVFNYKGGVVTVQGYVETAEGKVMIWDGTNVAAVTSDGQLKVSTT
jgi:hypothetical protein